MKPCMQFVLVFVNFILFRLLIFILMCGHIALCFALIAYVYVNVHNNL